MSQQIKPPVVHLKNISKNFPGVRALHNVSFDVIEGEVHALLGENGAGKSTLIKVLSGVYQQEHGEILIDGNPCLLHTPHEAQRAGIATIYQELLLLPELTVAENVYLGHAPKTRWNTINWSELYSRAEDILSSLDAEDINVRNLVGTLSVGDRQRVEIAKALSQQARVLIMDEPTASLTETDVNRLFETIRLLKKNGVAIIFISHRLGEVFELADRVSILRDGGYVGTKKTSETNQGELISMMVGRTIDTLFPKTVRKAGKVVLELKNYERIPLTKKTNIKIHAGEIVGLSGLVGSGRTELAQTIFGITPATGGSLELNGESVNIQSPEKAKKLKIAYLPEDRSQQGLIQPMKILENISLPLLNEISPRGIINNKAEEQLAKKMINQFNIRSTGNEQIVELLSGGNQQKVVLAKWLATKPDLLILDEPTRGIDVGAKAEIHKLMDKLASEGIAILMISSELPEILGMSDRIFVMREGVIVAELNRNDATQEKVAEKMMGVEQQ
jgi:rhamnose transport system ATP-binding protein